MSGAALQVTPADEQPHAVGGELDWSEAYAFDFYDEPSGLGGFTRMTVRPNEGAMDVGLSFFLPDGGFITARHVKAQPTNTADLEVEGVRYAVDEPLRRWRVSYDGPAHSLPSARDADQRAAWAKSRLERLIVELDVVAASAPASRGGESAFQQTCVVRGEVWVSGDRYALQAPGSRGRSWGADEEAAPRTRRAFSARFADGSALDVVRTLSEDGDLQRGWILRDGRVGAVGAVSIATTTEPDSYLQKRFDLTLVDADGGRHEVAGEVLHLAPLPSARNDRPSVLCESVARFTWQGRTGHGFASYLHRLDAGGKPLVPIE